VKAENAVLDNNTSELGTAELRESCRGVLPLPGRIADWMPTVLQDERLHRWVDEYGSPLNVVNPEPFLSHAKMLLRVTNERGVTSRPYFARKANKCLAFVDAAVNAHLGLDCASSQEIEQSLARGANPDKIICTAAVKDANLLKLCVSTGVTIALDNFQELTAVDSLLREHQTSAKLAIRVSGFSHRGKKLPSRFGFDIDSLDELLRYLRDQTSRGRSIAGLHFHLDGYCAAERVSAIRQLLPLVDTLRRAGETVSFLDIGGGLPVSYLANKADWTNFWHEHERALTGKRGEVTYRNDPLGRFVYEDQVLGEPRVYPFYQQPTREDWFATILDTKIDGIGIARQMSSRGIELRCQPGRSLLDDVGFTVARIEGVKPLPGDDIAVQLAMNGTQCRTSSVDFCIDPLLIKRGVDGLISPLTGRKTGYLFGGYCTESDLIIKRRLAFPRGIGIGDLIVLPNTAGYFMHFLESRSHQFPLARNLIFSPKFPEIIRLDAIDKWKSEVAE